MTIDTNLYKDKTVTFSAADVHLVSAAALQPGRWTRADGAEYWGRHVFTEAQIMRHYHYVLLDINPEPLLR